MARPPHMRRSQGPTVLLSLTIGLIVAPMTGPTVPQGPPSIPKKPNVVVLAEGEPGPQDPKPPKKQGSSGDPEEALLTAETREGHFASSSNDFTERMGRSARI